MSPEPPVPHAPHVPPNARPSCVMLLSLWTPPAAPWHARLVSAGADVHEFDSPFELARFVAQATSAPEAPRTGPDSDPAGGLR